MRWSVLLATLCFCSWRVPADVTFSEDVMALLSKAGCNAGACHGNANGKAGFKLSLRGESPEADYLALTTDQFYRRINLAAPEESLLLLKPLGQVAHDGGQRFGTNSWEYETLRTWIAAGASNDLATIRKIKRLDISPTELFVLAPTNTVQLQAKLLYADGGSRDVTERAVYEPAHPIVNISPQGLVTNLQPGETTVLVRYLDHQVPVRLAFIPARPGFQWSDPAPRNYIDRLVFNRLERLRMNPSALCSDEVFVRRAYLDLLGIPPTAAEAREFVLSRAPEKRRELVDALLNRPEFSEYWALKWSDLLRNEERILDRKGSELFHGWVAQSLADRKPIDQLVREIIGARGSTYRNPPANFYRALRTPVERGEAVAQTFLGIRVQCAQCHNHPFDRWSQDDYYDWMSVFSRVQYKVLENRRRDENDGHEFKGEQVVYLADTGSLQNPRTGLPSKPRFLGAATSDGQINDDLDALARWAASAGNPYFARMQANRIWFHLLGRGIVDPLDDFRASNPPSNPELLDALARDFVDHGFDLRHLIRAIMNSRTYQAAAATNESNAADENNFSRSLPRRLSAEQLFDCKTAVLGVAARPAGYPAGTRAAQMASALPERRREKSQAQVDQFLEQFGKPARLMPSECERSCEPTMGQAFQLVSGPVINELLRTKGNRLNDLLNSGKTVPEMVSELFWTALSRPPSQVEAEKFGKHLAEANDKRAALEDLAWALMNSTEFLFR